MPRMDLATGATRALLYEVGQIRGNCCRWDAGETLFGGDYEIT